MDNYQAPQPVFSPGSSPQPSLPPQSSYQQPKLNNHDGLKSILTTVAILLIAPILALSITTFGFQSYEVDGPSMEPTMYTHERLIIWKFGRTLSRITKNEYIPPRGTVVVFIKRGLYDFSNNKEKQLIKRIVGLPGDRVVVKDGAITVFNSDNPNGFNPDKTMDYGRGILEETEGNVDVTVEAGHVFLIGDNRDNSLDSRIFGTVPSADIVGTLSARILPLSEAKKF
jgi:signal peptidase I